MNTFDKLKVVKSNQLNQFHYSILDGLEPLTAKELKLLYLFLAIIKKSNNENSISLTLSEDEFLSFMEYGRQDRSKLQECADHLFKKEFLIPLKSGGFDKIHMFSKCRFDRNENDSWFFRFSITKEAAEHIYNLDGNFTAYDLWNILEFKSPYQIRMYELLRQYQACGHRELSVNELRELLGVPKDIYSDRTGWSDFRKNIIDNCKKALKAYTDICFDYERGNAGSGGSWKTIVFHIRENKEFTNKYYDRMIAGKLDYHILPSENTAKGINEYHKIKSNTDAEKRLIDCYRKYDADKLTDQGILEFDTFLRERRAYSLEQRVRVFNDILCKAKNGSKHPIQNYDSYIITSLKRWLK